MSDLPPTTHMMEFTVSTTALECRTCRNPPKPHCDGTHLYLCGAGGVVCRSCMPFHSGDHKASGGASHSSDCCRLLENIASRIQVKCAYGGYFRYCKLKDHQRDCLEGKSCGSASRKCRVETKLVCCSICGSKLRPPVFKRRYRDLLVCSDCRCADNADYLVSCPDLDYLFKCMMVKTRLPYCSPCNEDITNNAVVGSNIIIGKTNGKAPSKVGKTDKHIVERREDMSEDGSNDEMDDEEEDESPKEETDAMFEFMINPMVLECQTCRLPPKPDGAGSRLYLCGSSHVVCCSCMCVHKVSCGASHSKCCTFLEEIASRIEVKCDCGGYFPYCMLKEHQNHCLISKVPTSASKKCMLMAKLVCYSICGGTLQRPVFKGRYHDRLTCADCRRADSTKDNFVRCPELDYLFKCMMVKTQLPFCGPCDEDETNSPVVGSNIIIGKTNGKAPSKVGKTGKHIVEPREDMSEDGSNDKVDEEEDESSKELEIGKRVAEVSLNIPICNKKANIAMASGKKTDEFESTRPPAGNSTNIGKSNKVYKMDNHPETGKRVAKTVIKTSGYNTKAKIATPSGGQKTGEKIGAHVVMLHPAKN